VDCGGFVAAYWGGEVPHMAAPNPKFATGISPRSFWADSGDSLRELGVDKAIDSTQQRFWD